MTYKHELDMYGEPKKRVIPRHPSFGYATPEQIDKLRILGLGPEYDQIMKQIEIQNKKRGVME